MSSSDTLWDISIHNIRIIEANLILYDKSVKWAILFLVGHNSNKKKSCNICFQNKPCFMILIGLKTSGKLNNLNQFYCKYLN